MVGVLCCYVESLERTCGPGPFLESESFETRITTLLDHRPTFRGVNSVKCAFQRFLRDMDLCKIGYRQTVLKNLTIIQIFSHCSWWP